MYYNLNGSSGILIFCSQLIAVFVMTVCYNFLRTFLAVALFALNLSSVIWETRAKNEICGTIEKAAYAYLV